ncbi:MAG: alanine dehydrogenase, partial [Deltaproteobacteria bacterium]|nr:alanine dehydrogenase [Deltaproteobacteria bacterium]
MKIGIPKEIKNGETRVSLLPKAVASLTQQGHQVYVQKGAGHLIGISDEDYQKKGARLLPSLEKIYEKSQLIVKVKEPQKQEYKYFRENLKIFGFFHLAANPYLKKQLLKTKITALAYETLQNKKGETPLLKPMSQIAGRLSISLGDRFLQSHEGGKGLLLSSLGKTPGANVLVLGGGNVGQAAAELAYAMGAKVKILDLYPQKLKNWSKTFKKIKIFRSSPSQIKKQLTKSDLVIGAVHQAGKKTSRLITRS